MTDFAPGSAYFALFYQQKRIKSQKSNWTSTSKVHDKISENFREISAKFGFKMAETGDETFSGGQDIFQNSCNFKYFPVVMVAFLCASIFFILLRRVCIIF